MIKLKIYQIIDYYDYPQIILCKDQVGTKYICELINVDETYIKYIAVQISNNKLSLVLSNEIDLLDVFDNPEIPIYYTFQISNESENEIEVTNIEKSDILYCLPDPDLYVGNDFKIQELNQIAIKENKSIFELYIKEFDNENSVKSHTLIDFINFTQKLFDHGFSIISRSFSKKIKDRLKEYNSSQLNIFAFKPGSLKIYFNTNSYVDVFGNTDDLLIINKLQELLSMETSNIEEITNIFRQNKGHIINTIEKLCKKIIDSSTPFKLSYSLPNGIKYGEFDINYDRASIYYDIITKKEDLKEEIVKFTGYFMLADVEKGNWRLKIIDENKEISGKCDGELLSGIVIETKEYTIVCEERIVEELIYGKEKPEYILRSIDLRHNNHLEQT